MGATAESADLGERFEDDVVLLLFADQHFSRSSGFSCAKEIEQKRQIGQSVSFWLGEKRHEIHKKQGLIWWLN